jgi:eukaryotic-like serine/threonine-protein kinase
MYKPLPAICLALLLTLTGSLSLSMALPSLVTSASLLFSSSDIHEAYAQTEGNTTNSLSYTDPSTGITFQYPSSWEIHDVMPSLVPPETISAIRIIPPGQNTTGFVDNVIISALRVPNTTLDQYTEETLAVYKNNLSDTITVTKSEPTTFAGNPAHSIEFLEDFQGQQLHKLQVWTLIGDTLYLLTYAADESEFPQHLADVQSVIESLQISEGDQVQQQQLQPRQLGSRIFLL